MKSIIRQWLLFVFCFFGVICSLYILFSFLPVSFHLGKNVKEEGDKYITDFLERQLQRQYDISAVTVNGKTYKVYDLALSGFNIKDKEENFNKKFEKSWYYPRFDSPSKVVFLGMLKNSKLLSLNDQVSLKKIESKGLMSFEDKYVVSSMFQIDFSQAMSLIGNKQGEQDEVNPSIVVVAWGENSSDNDYYLAKLAGKL